MNISDSELNKKIVKTKKISKAVLLILCILFLIDVYMFFHIRNVRKEYMYNMEVNICQTLESAGYIVTPSGVVGAKMNFSTVKSKEEIFIKDLEKFISSDFYLVEKHPSKKISDTYEYWLNKNMYFAKPIKIFISIDNYDGEYYTALISYSFEESFLMIGIFLSFPFLLSLIVTDFIVVFFSSKLKK